MNKALTHLPQDKQAEFAKVFPRDTDQQRKSFTLLKKAYIDSRYKRGYKITKKQLEYLAERVKILQRLTKRVCGEKIELFGWLKDHDKHPEHTLNKLTITKKI